MPDPVPVAGLNLRYIWQLLWPVQDANCMWHLLQPGGMRGKGSTSCTVKFLEWLLCMAQSSQSGSQIQYVGGWALWVLHMPDLVSGPGLHPMWNLLQPVWDLRCMLCPPWTVWSGCCVQHSPGLVEGSAVSGGSCMGRVREWVHGPELAFGAR